MINLQPTAQTGALTLVLLVKLYRNQMIALLVKNGIVVKDNSSEQQITSLMANLLKVSKSFAKDLGDFVNNPTVAKKIADEIATVSQSEPYMKASGDGYLNLTNYKAPDSKTTDPVTGGNITTPPKKRFFDGLNLGDILKDGIGLFGDYTKSQSDVAIANAHALSEQAKADAVKAGNQTYIDPTTGEKKKIDAKPSDTKMSTTLIVVLSLVGVGILGTVIYLIARPKSA